MCVSDDGQNFIAHFYRNIARLVDRAMRKEDSSPQGQIVTEILQHLHACNNSVKVRNSAVVFTKPYWLHNGVNLDTYSVYHSLNFDFRLIRLQR